MDQGHLHAVWQVEFGGQRWRGHHGHDGHAVHVVGDRFAGRDAKSAPALALGGLQAFKQMKEGNGRGGVLLRRVRESGQHWIEAWSVYLHFLGSPEGKPLRGHTGLSGPERVGGVFGAHNDGGYVREDGKRKVNDRKREMEPAMSEREATGHKRRTEGRRKKERKSKMLTISSAGKLNEEGGEDDRRLCLGLIDT